MYGYAFLPIALPPLSQPITGSGQDQVAEPAWSYPLMVYQPTNEHYYQCIRTHRATAASEPGNTDPDPSWELYWTDLGIAVPDGWEYQYPDGNDWSEFQPAPYETEATVYSPMNRGFPTVCVFHEQRLILMANKDNPTAIYGSAIGDFFSFNPSSASTDGN